MKGIGFPDDCHTSPVALFVTSTTGKLKALASYNKSLRSLRAPLHAIAARFYCKLGRWGVVSGHADRSFAYFQHRTIQTSQCDVR